MSSLPFDIHELEGGERLLNVHPYNVCRGRVCCIHNMTDHHMRSWPQHWRGDTGTMERTCEHGVGHPDPDDWAGDQRMGGKKVHGCDGCCEQPVTDEQVTEAVASLKEMKHRFG